MYTRVTIVRPTKTTQTKTMYTLVKIARPTKTTQKQSIHNDPRHVGLSYEGIDEIGEKDEEGNDIRESAKESEEIGWRRAMTSSFAHDGLQRLAFPL